ncbi:Protein transport protein SEC13 [Nakaseomyces bracarensis]|uniref:Protein transport protein SEC13 n=1 Tax=Nakaseomyces bracarensis TaxID=273131 RepID=A0ABR4NW17_9SACH
MVKIENAHGEVIHHAALNYYGTRLATCSSDKTVKIFEVSESGVTPLETLTGHAGPVWYADWCHPSLGETLLATCGYDGRVMIWKEQNGRMVALDTLAVHSASVNCVKWAPHEYGMYLLCGSAEGKISVLGLKDGQVISTKIIEAHRFGVNCISWAAPTNTTSTTKEDEEHVRRFVSGGNDNLVKIWTYNKEKEEYELEDTLEGHTDAVTAVDWSPTTLLQSYLASVSKDKTCLVWTRNNDDKAGKWSKAVVNATGFEKPLGSVSWSLSGNLLAVSGDDRKVTIWKESSEGKWEQVEK